MLLFRDNQRVIYQRGLSEQIPNMAKFLGWQKAQCQAKFPHARVVYCLGSSAGGYAALASAHFLKVPVSWAFGPLTRIPEEDRVHPNDAVSDRCTDLTELLRESNGVTEYRIYYNESHEVDRIAAERVAGCPGVKFVPPVR